ncbi:MAG: hypothetical protein COA45_06745 [Zetaproteobacteria bacterium]|nr:MAG: hypothetical protein COA45_06745 [Zetaproteobacteria bacterium]
MKEERLNSGQVKEITTKTGGAMFLAISFTAVLTMGILIYLKVNGADNVVVEDLVQESVSPRESLTPIQEKIQAKLPVARNDMVVPSKDILQGNWVSLFGHGGVVSLNISGDEYEIIYMQTLDSAVRKYSRGSYKYNVEIGKITLYPSKDAGMPVPVVGVTYKILTMRHYDILVLKVVDDLSLYFIAPEEQIITKNYYPLFSYADYDGAPVLQFFPAQARE